MFINVKTGDVYPNRCAAESIEANMESVQCRYDWTDARDAAAAAAAATQKQGGLYIVTDAGDSPAPYGVMRAWQSGDSVSSDMGGSYAPCGQISAVSADLRQVETTVGLVFHRLQKSDMWREVRSGKQLVLGHVKPANSSDLEVSIAEILAVCPDFPVSDHEGKPFGPAPRKLSSWANRLLDTDELFLVLGVMAGGDDIARRVCAEEPDLTSHNQLAAASNAWIRVKEACAKEANSVGLTAANAVSEPEEDGNVDERNLLVYDAVYAAVYAARLWREHVDVKVLLLEMETELELEDAQLLFIRRLLAQRNADTVSTEKGAGA